MRKGLSVLQFEAIWEIQDHSEASTLTNEIGPKTNGFAWNEKPAVSICEDVELGLFGA